MTRESLLRAGGELGLPRRTSERELQRMLEALPLALAGLIQEIERQNEEYPEAVRVFLGASFGSFALSSTSWFPMCSSDLP